VAESRRLDARERRIMSRIAIIGSGISGLTCAYHLSPKHEVTLFEAGSCLGGHTATVDIELDGEQHAIDTGFIVFNDQTYPNFIKMLDAIGIQAKATEMSFSVQHTGSGIEYNGNSLSSLFAQKTNLLSLRFYRFVLEIIRFNRVCKKALDQRQMLTHDTLGEFLESERFSDFFTQHYILPMVAAIWSSSLSASRAFPLDFFLRFFHNHGLLDVVNRPQWYVVEGGSRSYIPALIGNTDDVRLNTPVTGIRRTPSGVEVSTAHSLETFDEVIIASHSNQALSMLTDATADERDILGGIAYRDNEVILHTDDSLLPNSRAAWASWNFYHDEQQDIAPSVTYNMNILQGIDSANTFCVTLNRGERIEPSKILRRFVYAHPEYTRTTLLAQSKRGQVCGNNRTHFCGAYWYNGFHEDGVKSALDVCRRFGVEV
jgi:hypothetical protein